MTSHYIWVWVVQHYFAKDSIILGGCTYYPSKHIKGRPLCQVSEDLEWFAFDCPLWLYVYIYIYILVRLFRFHTGKPLGHGQSIEKGGQTLMFFPKSAVNRKYCCSFPCRYFNPNRYCGWIQEAPTTPTRLLIKIGITSNHPNQHFS